MEKKKYIRNPAFKEEPKEDENADQKDTQNQQGK